MEPGLRRLSQEDCLKYPNLCSMERRQASGALIKVFNMLNGRSGILIDNFFMPHPASNRRSYHLNFFKPQIRTSLKLRRVSLFNKQVVYHWNALINCVITLVSGIQIQVGRGLSLSRPQKVSQIVKIHLVSPIF